MPGNREGGRKAAEKNKALYGKDFYRVIGSKGGRAKVPKGFASNPERASIAGGKGGRMSRRDGVTTGQGKTKEYYWEGGADEELVFKKAAGE